MVLVDTSIWIDHFRNSNSKLCKLLEGGDVSIHPFVIGELACGGLTNRAEVLLLLESLPQYTPISHEEYLHFLNSRRLYNKGIGFVDIHLLASAILNSDFICTRDGKLQELSKNLRVSYE